MTFVDTSFLVDLLRERAKGQRSPARALLEELADEELAVGVHVLCELAAGAELSHRPAVERERIADLAGSLTVVFPDDRFAPRYAKLLAEMSRSGGRIATMDLLIATAPVVDDAPLVTRNRKDFARVPGLEIVDY